MLHCDDAIATNNIRQIAKLSKLLYSLHTLASCTTFKF